MYTMNNVSRLCMNTHTDMPPAPMSVRRTTTKKVFLHVHHVGPGSQYDVGKSRQDKITKCNTHSHKNKVILKNCHIYF